MLPSLILRFSGGVGRSGGVDDGGFSGELDGGGFADGDCGVVSRFIFLDLTRFGGYLISNQKGAPLCHQHVHLIRPS